MRRLGSLLLSLAQMALALTALALALVLAALIALRSDWGRAEVLSRALVELQSVLAGKVSIAGLEGSLVGGTLVLHDVAIDDVERRPAIRARRVEVRYGLLSLLLGRPHLDDVLVEGAWLGMGQLGDGRFNLAALGAPSPPAASEPARPAPSGPPTKFSIRHVVVDGVARYEPATDRPGLRVLEGSVHVEGRLDFGAGVVISVHRIDVGLVTPSTAGATASGVVDIHGGHVWLRRVDLGLAFDGAALHRLLPEAKTRGPFRLHLDAEGQTNALTVALSLAAPRGGLTLDGRLGIPGDHFTFRGTLRAHDLDPGAAWLGAPHANASLVATAEITDGRGEVVLAQLVATALGARAHASGRSDLEGYGELQAEVDVRDLTRLRSVGAPELGGRLSANAHLVRSRHALSIAGDAHVASLVVPSLRIDRLDAHVATVDLAGEATVTARGVSAATIRLETLSLRAHGDRKTLSLAIDSDGPRATRLALTAKGVPLFVGGRPIGADARVQAVLFMTHGRVWNTAGPFALHAEPDLLGIQGLHLTSGMQSIAADGSWHRGGALAATLRADHLDARALEPIIAPGHRLPETDVHLGVTVRGTSAAPIADLELGGTSRPDEATGLLQLEGQVIGHYAARRLRASIGATIAGQALHGHCDVPITGDDGAARLDGAIAFSVLFDPTIGGFLLPALTDLMPLSLRALQGKISGDLTLSGKVATPRLALTLHIGSWGSSPIKGSGDLVLRYGDARLDATLAARLSSLPAGGGAGGGTLDAYLASAVDLGSILVLPSRLRRNLLSSPVNAGVRVHALDLAAVPFASLGVDAPGSAGRVDGTLSLGGTLGDPALIVNLAGTDIAAPHVDHGAVALSIDYRDKHAHIDASASLRSAPLFHLRGYVEVDPAHIEQWRDIALHLDGVVPPYPLATVPELGASIGGTLGGKLSLRGSIGRPEGHARLHVEGLRIGAIHFSRFLAAVDFDGARVTAALDADQPTGRLHVDLTAPLGAAQPFALAARADNFLLDFESAALPGLRTARGTMNADLKITGTRARPKISGTVRVDHGAIALAQSPMLYHDLALDLSFVDGRVTLRRLDLVAAGGTLGVSAEGRLDGLDWTAVDARADLRKFPVRESGIAAWVDAHADLHAQRHGHTLRGRVVVRDGLARLADLTSGHSLQPTGTPTDVHYIDAAGQRADAAKAGARAAPHADAAFTIGIPGPFNLRSGELSAALAGQLEVALAGETPSVGGAIESQGGSIVLFSRRYDLDRARVVFDGSTRVDPQLDVRISRPVADATIVVEVHGSATHPELVFASLPPVYTEAQIIGIIISGDQGANQVSDQSLDEQVVGALSGAIVGAIKNQLAPQLPIDVMKVALQRDLDGLERTRIEVGKYVGAGIYVSYVHQFGGAGTRHLNQNQLQVDYRFARNYEVESQFGDAGAGSVDLFWTHRF